MFITRKISHPL